MIRRSSLLLAWLIGLFDPPPRDSMTRWQKVVRVFLFTLALTVICVLLSMLAAVAIFAIEQGRKMMVPVSELVGDLGIIFISMMVNTACVIVLLEVKKADRKLPNRPVDTAPPKIEGE